MRNIHCKSCSEVLDERLVVCPNCGANPRSGEKVILSKEQVTLIWKHVRGRFIRGAIFWLGILSLVFGLGLWQVYDKTIGWTEAFVKQQVQNEFNEPRIKDTVRDVARDRADSLLKTQIAPEIDNFKQRIAADTEAAKTLADNAQTQFDQLRSIIELEDAAHFGSRKAYLTLKKIGASPDPFATMANRRTWAIERDLISYRSIPGIRFALAITRNGEKTEADRLSTAELFMYLESSNMPKEQIPAMMGHIARKPRHEVCREAKNLFERSDSLIACAATCGILREVLGDRAPFLAFNEWLLVCEQELRQSEGVNPQK